MNPQIVIQDTDGFHNTSDYRRRLREAKTYQDLSTIQVVATRGVIAAKVVQSWQNLMTPMNQKFMRMYIIGYEVGEAYNQAINTILNHPDLSKWQYILTLEEDNMPAPDSLFKLKIFKDEKIPRPWFQTLQKYENGGAEAITQDLYFFRNIKKLGYKVACDTRVKVGHYSIEDDIVW